MQRIIRIVFWLSLLVIPKIPFVAFQVGKFLLNSPFFPLYTAFLWGCSIVFMVYVCAGVYLNLMYLFGREVKFPNWRIIGVFFSASLLFIPSSVLLKSQLAELRASRYCDFALIGIVDPTDKHVFEDLSALVLKRFKPNAVGVYSVLVPPDYRLEIWTDPSCAKVRLSLEASSNTKADILELPLPITTKKGIKLGDTEATVRNVYAGPYFEETLSDKSRELIYSIPKLKQEMHLIFKDNKLKSIQVTL